MFYQSLESRSIETALWVSSHTAPDASPLW